MPTFEEHRQKCDIAKSTQLTLQAADPHEHADWIVITAFYQALHWVDAFFALDNYHPGGTVNVRMLSTDMKILDQSVVAMLTSTTRVSMLGMNRQPSKRHPI